MRKQVLRDKLIKHKAYIRAYGDDMPEGEGLALVTRRSGRQRSSAWSALLHLRPGLLSVWSYLAWLSSVPTCGSLLTPIRLDHRTQCSRHWPNSG
jgi:hypothetical protein